MFCTYILINKNKNKTYVGYTGDLKQRLTQHNKGNSIFTKRYKPWVLLYKEMYNTKLEAINSEKYLKSKSGRHWIKENLFNK